MTRRPTRIPPHCHIQAVIHATLKKVLKEKAKKVSFHACLYTMATPLLYTPYRCHIQLRNCMMREEDHAH
jgi:hypothetical protein